MKIISIVFLTCRFNEAMPFSSSLNRLFMKKKKKDFVLKKSRALKVFSGNAVFNVFKLIDFLIQSSQY